MGIDPAITMSSELFLEPRDEPGHRRSFRGQQLKQDQACSNPVPFGDMPRKTNAAALFGPEQDSALDHLSRDIFKADSGFDQLQAVDRTHFINHRGSGQSLDHAPVAMSIFHEMVQ